MSYENYAPWEHYPKVLSHFEIGDPISVIRFFFDAVWIESHQAHLKEWRNYVFSDKFYNHPKHGPVEILATYELNLKLLEALYLVCLKYKQEAYKYERPNEAQLLMEKNSWEYYPANLSPEERLDPYELTGNIFEAVPLKDYRDCLNIWLHAALETSALEDLMTPGEVNELYENTLKLYDAAWIILHRKNNSAESTLSTNADIDSETEPNEGAESHNITPLYALKSELSKEKQAKVEQMKNIILKEIPSVRLIVLLGFCPKPSNYFFLVLINDDEKKPEHELANKMEDYCRSVGAALMLVHKAGKAIEGIRSGNRFWSTVFYSGIHIYRANDFILPDYKPLTVEEWINRSKADWARWGAQGKAFFYGGQNFLKEGDYNLAAFMLHQACQSCLFAIIKVLSGYRFATHNLSRMLRLTLLFTPEIKATLNLNTKEGVQLFNLLQKGYADARYKSDFVIDEQSARELLKMVEQLLKKIEAVYDQFIRS